LLALGWAVTIDAKTPASSKQSKSASKSGKQVAAKSKSRKGVTRARRSTPRQSAPTPERYRQIQQALAEKGYDPGPVDGQWGPEWVEALKKFQSEQNLTPDGKLGALSLIALGLGPQHDSMSQLAGKPESIE
jgi:peptidoglycan hydrolase-like protein with peptidoglycan-binding domain